MKVYKAYIIICSMPIFKAYTAHALELNDVRREGDTIYEKM